MVQPRSLVLSNPGNEVANGAATLTLPSFLSFLIRVRGEPTVSEPGIGLNKSHIMALGVKHSIK